MPQTMIIEETLSAAACAETAGGLLALLLLWRCGWIETDRRPRLIAVLTALALLLTAAEGLLPAAGGLRLLCSLLLLGLWLARRRNNGAAAVMALPAAALSCCCSLAWLLPLLTETLLQLRGLALSDSLTGLGNRRAAGIYLRRQLKRLRQGKVFLLLLDADRFKEINDRFGHAAGDQALLELTAVLRDCCMAGERLFRLGGDEFLICGVCRREQQVRTLISRIEQRLAAPAEQPYILSVSCGYALYDRTDRLSPAELFSAADQAMYRRKRQRI